MTDALNPEPLLRALHEAGVQHIIIGGFAVNAHGVIRPSRDLAIVPDPDPANLERLAALLADLDARHVGLGDFHADEFPFDPTNPEDIRSGANFRLETAATSTMLSVLASTEEAPQISALGVNPRAGASEERPVVGGVAAGRESHCELTVGRGENRGSSPASSG